MIGFTGPAGATELAVVPPRGRAAWSLHFLPVIFAVVAEAAWMSVLSGLVAELLQRDPVLAIPQLAAFVALGVVAAHVLAPPLGRAWPGTALALVVGGALVGVLAAPEARGLLVTGGLGPALIAHPAGVVGGIGVLRGFRYAWRSVADGALGPLVGLGMIWLSFAAALGGMIAEPWRSRFLGDTMVAAVAFGASSALGSALARQIEVAEHAGRSWRANPAWIGLLVAVIALMAAIAIPTSVLAVPAIQLLLGLAVAPVIVIGLLTGWSRTTVRNILITLSGTVVLIVALRLAQGLASQFAPASGAGGVGPGPVTADSERVVLAVGGGLLGIVAVAGILILLRIWMRQVTTGPDGTLDTRTIDRSVGDARIGRRRWRPGRATPHDAAAAYRALLDDLASRGSVRREPAETPAEHAHRVRHDVGGAFGLDLLAADYALARFGGIRLSAHEDRRAVARWRRLRGRLGRSGGRAAPRTDPLPGGAPDEAGPA